MIILRNVIMRNTLRCMVALSLMAHVVVAEDASAGKSQKKYKGPVKVFILAGQSNMEGPANTNTFAQIGKNLAEANLKMIKQP